MWLGTDPNVTPLAHVSAAHLSVFALRQLLFALKLHGRIGTVETLANLHYWRATVDTKARGGWCQHDRALRVAMAKARAEFGA